MTAPARRIHGGAHHAPARRLSVHLTPAAAALGTRSTTTRGAAHAPAATVRHTGGVGRRGTTIRPHAGGDAVPLPHDAAPQHGSAIAPGSDAGTASPGPAAPSSGPATGTAGPGAPDATSAPAPEATDPGAAGDAPSSAIHDADPSADRPQVTHNDSASDPGASGAAGAGADGATGSSDAPPADQQPSPPPVVTANADAASA